MNKKEMMEYMEKYHEQNEIEVIIETLNEIISGDEIFKDWFSFKQDIFKDFREDLIKAELTGEKLKNNYALQMKDRLKNIFSMKEEKYNDFSKIYFIFIGSGVKNNELLMDYKAMAIINAIIMYDLLLITKETIKNEKFDELFMKYFSGSEEDELKRFIKNALNDIREKIYLSVEKIKVEAQGKVKNILIKLIDKSEYELLK